jgi:methionyl-tRNA formyltransferase
VTYARKILKNEAHIDWTKPAREIDCLIRGLSPAPGAWCEVKGERLKILYAEPVEGYGAPGTVLDDGLTVACGKGALRLARLQRAGKSVMTADELLRGFALRKDDMLT